MNINKNAWWAGLVLVVAAFIIAKWNDLYIPYFWDELGVYAPGALKMKDTGQIGILPANLEPVYSRGHPLLCFFFHAATFNIFGDSVFVGHATSLFTGCCTIIAGYFFAKSVFSKQTALLFSFLLAIQPVFYAMSGVIAPENLLTLFSILSLWAVVERKWIGYLIAGSCAILTKESALAIPSAVLLYLFIQSIKQKDLFTWRRFLLFFYAAVPILVFGLFLLIQKQQNGWYFFPMHAGAITTKWGDIDATLNRLFIEAFFDQGRWLISIPALLYMLGQVVALSPKTAARDTVLLTALFLIAAQAFCASNFYLPRYTLYIIPFIVLMGAQAFTVFLSFFSRRRVQLVLAALFCSTALILGIIHMDRKAFHDTTDMGYRHVVHCVADAIHWSEQQPWRYSRIDANFPVFQGLDDARNGYINGKPWPHSESSEDTVRHAILFHFEENLQGVPRKYHVLKKFDRHYAHVSVIEYD